MHKSTRILILLVVLIVLMPVLSRILPVAGDEDSTPHNIYLFLHVLGAVLFLGNIIITGIWMFLAEKSRSISIIQFATRAINWMDVFFTAPGVALLLLGGLMLAPSHGGLYKQSWIIVGMGLFSLSGIIWLIFLIPDQHRLISLSNESLIKKDKLSEKFFKVLVVDQFE